MRSRFALLIFMLLFTTCVGPEEASPTSTPEPSPTPAPTQTPLPAQVTLKGPDCPDGFREANQVEKDVAINANGVLTLTLGSTPSIPCGWQAAEISDLAIIRQMDRESKWPGEDVTPMPGAPGTEIWTFEALQAGESVISLPCTCLGEEGTGEELAGTLIVSVTVK
jgi:inhibitor of cysteine peptidase